MDSIRIDCNTRSGDYLSLHAYSYELMLFEEGRCSTMDLTPESLYRLVDFIQENIERPEPIKRSDLVRCPSGCVALVNQVQNGRSLITTPANVSEWIDNKNLEVLYRDGE